MSDVMRVSKAFRDLVEELKAEEEENIKISRGIDTSIADSEITKKIADEIRKSKRSRIGML